MDRNMFFIIHNTTNNEVLIASNETNDYKSTSLTEAMENCYQLITLDYTSLYFLSPSTGKLYKAGLKDKIITNTIQVLDEECIPRLVEAVDGNNSYILAYGVDSNYIQVIDNDRIVNRIKDKDIDPKYKCPIILFNSLSGDGIKDIAFALSGYFYVLAGSGTIISRFKMKDHRVIPCSIRKFTLPTSYTFTKIWVDYVHDKVFVYGESDTDTMIYKVPDEYSDGEVYKIEQSKLKNIEDVFVNTNGISYLLSKVDKTVYSFNPMLSSNFIDISATFDTSKTLLSIDGIEIGDGGVSSIVPAVSTNNSVIAINETGTATSTLNQVVNVGQFTGYKSYLALIGDKIKSDLLIKNYIEFYESKSEFPEVAKADSHKLYISRKEHLMYIFNPSTKEYVELTK